MKTYISFRPLKLVVHEHFKAKNKKKDLQFERTLESVNIFTLHVIEVACESFE